jgi:hypothetical protein
MPRGDAVCPNRKAVSERIANTTILKLVNDAVKSKDFKRWVQLAMQLAEPVKQR